MESKQIICLSVFFLLGIMLVSVASAFSFGTPYTFDYPLQMYPGETKEVTLSLQNSDVEEGITAKVELSQTKEIAKLDKSSYTISNKGEANPILTVTVPADANIGDQYDIVMKASQVNAVGGGMVSFRGEITRGIRVSVVEKPIESQQPAPAATGSYWWIILVIIIIIAAAIIVYLVFARKKK